MPSMKCFIYNLDDVDTVESCYENENENENEHEHYIAKLWATLVNIDWR